LRTEHGCASSGRARLAFAEARPGTFTWSCASSPTSFSSEKAPTYIAALGVELQVPTMDGDETVKVPAGAQPGDTVVLRGKGLPHLRRSGRGNLIVHLKVTVPRKLTAAQKELLRALVEGEDKHPGVLRKMRDLIEGSG
jgi:DnaJ-class molecular chaperone